MKRMGLSFVFKSCFDYLRTRRFASLPTTTTYYKQRRLGVFFFSLFSFFHISTTHSPQQSVLSVSQSVSQPINK